MAPCQSLLGSSRLSNWIVDVIGDPGLLLDPLVTGSTIALGLVLADSVTGSLMLYEILKCVQIHHCAYNSSWLLYGTIVKIDTIISKKALGSLLSSFSSLGDKEQNQFVSPKERYYWLYGNILFNIESLMPTFSTLQAQRKMISLVVC